MLLLEEISEAGVKRRLTPSLKSKRCSPHLESWPHDLEVAHLHTTGFLEVEEVVAAGI